MQHHARSILRYTLLLLSLPLAQVCQVRKPFVGDVGIHESQVAQLAALGDPLCRGIVDATDGQTLLVEKEPAGEEE